MLVLIVGGIGLALNILVLSFLHGESLVHPETWRWHTNSRRAEHDHGHGNGHNHGHRHANDDELSDPGREAYSSTDSGDGIELGHYHGSSDTTTVSPIDTT